MSLPTDLRDILVKLEFLSQITEGSKINTKEMSLTPASSWITSIKRTLTHEDRTLTIQYINEVIRETGQIMGRYRSHPDYISLVINALVRAKAGIERLAGTYQTSPDIVAHIRVLVAAIDLQLHSIKVNHDV